MLPRISRRTQWLSAGCGDQLHSTLPRLHCRCCRSSPCRSGCNLGLRLQFASSSTSPPPHPMDPKHDELLNFPLSSNRLGLLQPLVGPQLSSLLRLPEVSRALDNSDTSLNDSGGIQTDPSAVIDDLSRAVDIFASFSPGGPEHKASLALLAECQRRCGLFGATVSTIRKLSRVFEEDNSSGQAGSLPSLSVSLALAKALWLEGNFKEAKAVCDHLLVEDDEEDGVESSTTTRASLLGDGSSGMPIQCEASARSGQAIMRLMMSETLDDCFSVRDPFRRVVRTLERSQPHSFHLALAHLNYGVAEAVYAHIVQRHHSTTVPLDAALRSWKQGLTTLKRIPTSTSRGTTWKAALETRLRGNMAWALLEMSEAEPKELEQASELAGQALKLYDQHLEWREGFGHTLALVATCYHKSGSAVTAEGLLQTAVDHYSQRHSASDPQAKLEEADVYQRYANLCRDWDRREGDAERLSKQVSQLHASLPVTWQNKSNILSSIWFWTPSA